MNGPEFIAATAAILFMAASNDTAWQGAGLLLVYSLGIGLPFLAAALFQQLGLRRWRARGIPIGRGALIGVFVAGVAFTAYPFIARDPIATAARLYASLGFAFDETTEAGMRAFLEAKRAEPASVHLHDLAGFALTPEAVRDRFGSYGEKFDL